MSKACYVTYACFPFFLLFYTLLSSFLQVRTITALSLAALAEASAPYGIESFDSVLKPLWKGIRAHRGKVLAAFLKAIGFIIPLMDAMYASYYTREVSACETIGEGNE